MSSAWVSCTFLWIVVVLMSCGVGSDEFLRANDFLRDFFDPLTKRYAHFPDSLRLEMLEETRRMFTFGYDCYMKCAFPLDELDPINCKGRGPDYAHPENININDVLGDYSLTLVDTLDTLAVMRNVTEFQRAVRLVIETVSFDKLNTVQVFEATIRVLGGLLSAHLLIEDEAQPFGDLAPDWYMGDLLTLAHDLADRLLAAFDTSSGLPHPRVNLVTGVPPNGVHESCTAGAGSLVPEMGLLSRLLGDPTYESLARRAVNALWQIRDNSTGLLGFVMNVHSKAWISRLSGLGAGMDSFYEYLLKSYILFSDECDRDRFETSYETIMEYMRHGRLLCNAGEGVHPIFVNVDMRNGDIATHWIDSLQAAFPGVQVLHGDIEEAICHHAVYYGIWKKFGCLPERYNWKLDAPDVRFYPLRPELMESTYLLYRATKSPFYLHVGRDILINLLNHTKANCGHATIHDVFDKSLEDRQESFFLSETCKYLFLLFDTDNPVNKMSERYLFTTEGHLVPIKTRDNGWEPDRVGREATDCTGDPRSPPSTCDNPGIMSPHILPIKSKYLSQLFEQLGVSL